MSSAIAERSSDVKWTCTVGSVGDADADADAEDSMLGLGRGSEGRRGW